MKLTDLAPRWWGNGDGRRLGVTFLCPCCRRLRIGVAFANPVDGGPPSPVVGERMPRVIRDHVHVSRTFDVPPGCLWQRSGADFAIMSLMPSVDASKAGHWHGFVSNGEVR